MGRKPVAQEDRRSKIHTANVMAPNWVYAGITEVATQRGLTIKATIECALTEFVKKHTKRAPRKTR